MSTPTISLCMIVRDEAEMLPAFLERTRGLYDELCVVDTGSKDATPAILAEAGAVTQEMAWQDDFALARNASLSLATGTWTLCLDPDELPDAALIKSIRDIAGCADVGAATLASHHALDHGYDYTAHVLRYFRRDPSIGFAYRIHEDASQSVLAYLATHGQRMVQAEGRLEHLGYRRSRAVGRDKKRRDGDLLRAAVAAQPDDLYSWFKLLELGRYYRDPAWLAEHAPDAARALATATPEQLRADPHLGEMIVLTAQGLFAGEPHDTRDYMLPFADRIAPSAAYWLRLAECHEILGDVPQAIAAFERCVGLRDRTPNRQLATTRPLLGLARLAITAGEASAALRLLDMALAENPRDPEALLAMLSLARNSGGNQGADRIAQAYRDSYGETAELRGAVGEVALAAGDLPRALVELRAAAAAVPEGPYGALLARAEAQVGA